MAARCNVNNASGDAPPRDDAPSLRSWGVVTKADELSTGDARGPNITADRLELYFSGIRAGGMGNYDIYKSTRTTAQAAWSAPALVTELSTSMADADPCVSSDGLTMWFSTDRDTVQSYDIWGLGTREPQRSLGRTDAG